jgi:predicted enzyme related to lactoylglutathione lyase
MATRLTNVAIDSADQRALARWWGAALGWEISYEDEEETDLVPPAGEPGLELSFGPVPEAKVGLNRLHLDLSSRSLDDQAATVARLEAAGARRIDVGQDKYAAWVVLTDPEGNEFCVLEPRHLYEGCGPIAAIVVKAHDPAELAAFWQSAAGGEIKVRNALAAGIRPATAGPWLEFVRNEDPKTVKDRIHLDLRPYAADDQKAEVARLLGLGAVRTDVGQSGEESWVVLADPEGNEFCVLRPMA